MRSTPAIRVEPVPFFLPRSGLPPDTAVCGVSRSQLAKCRSSGNALRSGPASVRIVRAAPVLIPSIRVRSTPVTRHSAAHSSSCPFDRIACSFFGFRCGGTGSSRRSSGHSS